ncbi:hypothetical protein ACJJTC_011099 [Scirpophaga incertulas]
MAAGGTKWRTIRIGAVLFTMLIQVINGYEDIYTISQHSPKSVVQNLPLGAVLQTSNIEDIVFRIEPSVTFEEEDLTPEDVVGDVEEENLVRVARSADPDRQSRSIHVDDAPVANNEIDDHIELHNKRKYYEIRPTKSLVYNSDEEDIIMSSDGFGDRLDFKFPGEGKRVPAARALTLPGPRIRPTAVQPIFATPNPNLNQARQNTEIQNIITGIVKLLNGNVNVQANSQLLNGRPGRPMASRINNRGPPRISDLPPLPEFDPPVTPPIHVYHPTKTPPPYPFDRPPHHGVNLPDQIVPPMTHRPGFHRPMPPWQRPRPRPPNRRPNPSLPMYKPSLPPLPLDLPEHEDKIPEADSAVNESEASHSENNLHHEDDAPPLTLPEANNTETGEDTSPETTTTSSTSTSTSESSSTTSTTTTTEATTNLLTTPIEESTTAASATDKLTTQSQTTTEKITITTEKVKTEKPTKPEKEKKKDSGIEKDKNKDKYKIMDEKFSNKTKEDPIASIIESSFSETKATPTLSLVSPTPTEGLVNYFPTPSDAMSSVNIIKTSSIDPQSTASSQGIPYHPYRPRPGIVLDDPDFKPHGSRFRPTEVSVITAPETRLPGYGEIFDVTVSAIQGPGEKGGSVHIENINISGQGEHDDIIVSPSGEQGFVSIDGKRTYLNLFDSSTVAGVSIHPTAAQTLPQASVPPPASPPHLPSLGTGVAVPADDDVVPPPRRPRPHQSHHPAVHTRPQPPYRRPQPTVRIDTCIVGDDSTCDQAQNEMCRTESGISSCQCRPGYAKRSQRDPCRRVVSLLMSLRVDRFYERKVAWDSKLADKESDPYQQLSMEAVRAIDSAFSMTPFSDDFVSGSVNSVHKGDEQNQGVFVNYTILIQETPETLRPAVATNIQKQLLGALRRRGNNVGTSALYVASPAGSVLPLTDLDECASPDLNDCHQLATCINTFGGFRCECPSTTLDESGTSRKGRKCRACGPSLCSDRGVCHYANGQPQCTCNSGYYGSTCEVDGEVVGAAAGASVAAALVIALTLAALLAWSRKWSREQKAIGMGSPVFSYMGGSTIKTPSVGQPPYQVSLEERMRWAQIAEAMAQAQANHYAQPDTQTIATRPSSAMFGGYPTLPPPVPMPRMALHNGTLNTATSRTNTVSQHNLYGYGAESGGSEASGPAHPHDLLVPRPKSRARHHHNQTGIYYDLDYENAPEAIYGSKGIPLSTYTVSRGPPFYR